MAESTSWRRVAVADQQHLLPVLEAQPRQGDVLAAEDDRHRLVDVRRVAVAARGAEGDVIDHHALGRAEGGISDADAVLRLQGDVDDGEVGDDDVVAAREDEAAVGEGDGVATAVDGDVGGHQQRVDQGDGSVEGEAHDARPGRVRQPLAQRARARVVQVRHQVEVEAGLPAAPGGRAEAFDDEVGAQARVHSGIPHAGVEARVRNARVEPGIHARVVDTGVYARIEQACVETRVGQPRVEAAGVRSSCVHHHGVSGVDRARITGARVHVGGERSAAGAQQQGGEYAAHGGCSRMRE